MSRKRFTVRKRTPKSNFRVVEGTLNTKTFIGQTLQSETNVTGKDYPSFKDHEYFSDIVGNRGGFNPCRHYKISGDPGKYPIDWYYKNGSYPPQYRPRVVRSLAKTPMWSIPFVLEPKLLIPPARSLHKPAMKAYKHFTEQFPEDVSIANFLIELRGGIKEILPRITNLKKAWAQGLLGWEFGVKPFISDLLKIGEAWSRAMRRLNFLKDHNYKKVVVHYSDSIDLDHWDWNLYKDYDPILATARPLSEIFAIAHYRPTEPHGKLTCGALIEPRLEGLDLALGELVALASTLGLNNPAKILWNAIPYSFLLDWVINTDSVLNDLAIQVLPGTIEIYDVWYSYIVEYDIQVYGVSRSGIETDARCSLTGYYRVKDYLRSVGLPINPDPSLWLEFELSAKQWALLLALIHVRVP